MQSISKHRLAGLATSIQMLTCGAGGAGEGPGSRAVLSWQPCVAHSHAQQCAPALYAEAQEPMGLFPRRSLYSSPIAQLLCSPLALELFGLRGEERS